MVGFGSQWNCTIQIGEPGKGQGESPQSPPASHGCMNQHATYTLGETPAQNEYTIIVKEFKAEDYDRACALSAELRAKRVHNMIWPQIDGSYVVSVGRYWTEKQAEDKLQAIQDRGYPKAYVAMPKTEKDIKKPPPPSVDVAGIVAMLIVVTLVVLAVATQAKNKS
ncbi:hypothetical protein HUU05_11685 [candidate division KSB1 bacterium]|nr:hypothetical protein [candidate division KSB1 bacterium]